MRNIFKIIYMVALTASISACTARSTNHYTAPDTSKIIVNEAYFYEPLDTVWSRMVKGLSSEFFVINNVEKDSRIMNLSFSSSTPGNYVDCGQSKRSYTSPQGETTIYNYKTSDSSTYYATDINNTPRHVRRSTNLTTRINIYLAHESDKIVVTVNVLYILRISLRYNDGYEEHVDWSFSTNQPYSEYGEPGKCIPTGKIENLILRAAGANL